MQNAKSYIWYTLWGLPAFMVVQAYASTLRESGETVVLEGYTEYPKFSGIHLRNRSAKAFPFALALRIPAWCDGAKLSVNGRPEAAGAAGSFVTLTRTWKAGDRIEIDFPMPVRAHLQDGMIAFTAGPVLLARDLRFGDGPIDANVLAELCCGKRFDSASRRTT